MVTATRMAMRLRQLSGLLQDEQLIGSDSVAAIEKAAVTLDRQRQNQDWSYSVTPTDPIRFCPAITKKIDHILPSLQATLGVIGRQQDEIKGFFSALNITLEFHYEGKLLDRWHIDLANDHQAGPVFHLQHGGHSSGSTDRGSEGKLSAPRWMHPPMDIILACELVVANFFQANWLRLRKNPTWIALIREAESFCYTDYFNTLYTHHSSQQKQETMLHKLWAT